MARTPDKWDVEDEAFWESTGKKIANRNLWVSIPNLLLGFSVWICWGMIAKYIQKLHFGNPELFNFTFLNGGAPYDEARLQDAAVHAAGGRRPDRRDPSHPQLVHDRDLRGAQRQVHDDAAALVARARRRHRAAEPRHAVLHLHHPGGARRCRRRRVRLVDVQHQLLLSKEAAGARARSKRRARQPRRQPDAVPHPVGGHLRAVRSARRRIHKRWSARGRRRRTSGFRTPAWCGCRSWRPA